MSTPTHHTSASPRSSAVAAGAARGSRAGRVAQLAAALPPSRDAGLPSGRRQSALTRWIGCGSSTYSVGYTCPSSGRGAPPHLQHTSGANAHGRAAGSLASTFISVPERQDPSRAIQGRDQGHTGSRSRRPDRHQRRRVPPVQHRRLAGLRDEADAFTISRNSDPTSPPASLVTEKLEIALHVRAQVCGAGAAGRGQNSHSHPHQGRDEQDHTSTPQRAPGPPPTCVGGHTHTGGHGRRREVPDRPGPGERPGALRSGRPAASPAPSRPPPRRSAAPTSAAS